MAHNIDFHCVMGPGGGAPALFAEQGETKAGVFKMMYPGVFIYHCAAAPLPVHVGNGMYGMIIVDPEEVSDRKICIQSQYSHAYFKMLVIYPKFRIYSRQYGPILICPSLSLSLCIFYFLFFFPP